MKCYMINHETQPDFLLGLLSERIYKYDLFKHVFSIKSFVGGEKTQ